MKDIGNSSKKKIRGKVSFDKNATYLDYAKFYDARMTKLFIYPYFRFLGINFSRIRPYNILFFSTLVIECPHKVQVDPIEIAYKFHTKIIP